MLIPGEEPLPSDASCRNGESSWFERTAYRKIPFSTCEGGTRLDRGREHLCPGLQGHSAMFWLMVIVIPFLFATLVGWWYYRRSGMARGYACFLSTMTFSIRRLTFVYSTIRLPMGGETYYRSHDSGFLATAASVPYFLLGLAGIAWEAVASRAEDLFARVRPRSGYRNLPVDEDAQILRFEDEE